jgi:hypothetical protein
MWGTFSDNKTGLSFTIVSCPHQRSHSRVRVPRDSWSYFTVSDLRLSQPGGPSSRICIPQERWSGYIPRHWLPFSSPPTTRRATVKVFDPACTRGSNSGCLRSSLYSLGAVPTENTASSVVAYWLIAADVCLPQSFVATSAELPQKTPAFYCCARLFPWQCVYGAVA